MEYEVSFWTVRSARIGVFLVFPFDPVMPTIPGIFTRALTISE